MIIIHAINILYELTGPPTFAQHGTTPYLYLAHHILPIRPRLVLPWPRGHGWEFYWPLLGGWWWRPFWRGGRRLWRTWWWCLLAVFLSMVVMPMRVSMQWACEAIISSSASAEASCQRFLAWLKCRSFPAILGTDSSVKDQDGCLGWARKCNFLTSNLSSTPLEWYPLNFS